MSAVALAIYRELTELGPQAAAHLSSLVREELGFTPLRLMEVSAKRDRLHRERTMPAEVSARLRMVEELSESRAHLALCMVLQTEGVAQPPGLSRQLLALWAVCTHPTLARRAHRARRTQRSVRVRALKGRAPGKPRAMNELAEARLQRELGLAFAESGRTALCRVVVQEEAAGLHFLVDHGSHMRHVHAVEEHQHGVDEACVPLRPRRRDYLHYEPRTGVLSVGAWDQPTLMAYAQAFGPLLFDDPTWFTPTATVSLEPIRVLGRRALMPSGQVTEVQLVGVTLELGGEDGGKVDLTGQDVFAHLESSIWAPVLQSAVFVAAKLRIRVAGVARMRTLELRPPMTVSYDWSRGGDAVRRFLEQRGFLVAEVG